MSSFRPRIRAVRLSGVTWSSLYRAYFAARRSSFSANSLAACGFLSATSTHYAISFAASSSYLRRLYISLLASSLAVVESARDSSALASLASSSAIRSSRNLMIILSRARFFSEASKAVCLSLLDFVRAPIYYSYYLCWISMFSKFSESSFSTLLTRSFIACNSWARYLYNLKALGLFWNAPAPVGVLSTSSRLESSPCAPL